MNATRNKATKLQGRAAYKELVLRFLNSHGAHMITFLFKPFKVNSLFCFMGYACALEVNEAHQVSTLFDQAYRIKGKASGFGATTTLIYEASPLLTEICKPKKD